MRKKRAAAKVSAGNVEEPEHSSESTPEPEKEAIMEYKWDMCDFTTSAKNGVGVHKGHKHKYIEILLNENNKISLNMSVPSEKRDETMSQHNVTDLESTENDEQTEVSKKMRLSKKEMLKILN